MYTFIAMEYPQPTGTYFNMTIFLTSLEHYPYRC